MRSNTGNSFNFTLPLNWTSGGVLTLAANIDTNNTVQELSEVNTTTLQYKFNDVPALNVIVVPIEYVHTGRTSPGIYPPPDTSYMQEGCSVCTR